MSVFMYILYLKVFVYWTQCTYVVFINIFFLLVNNSNLTPWDICIIFKNEIKIFVENCFIVYKLGNYIIDEMEN